MSIAIALGAICAVVLLALAIGAAVIWFMTSDWMRGFTDDDLAVAWRRFLEGASRSGAVIGPMTVGQVNAYRWLQARE